MVIVASGIAHPCCCCCENDCVGLSEPKGCGIFNNENKHIENDYATLQDDQMVIFICNCKFNI